MDSKAPCYLRSPYALRMGSEQKLKLRDAFTFHVRNSSMEPVHFIDLVLCGIVWT